jgi:CheY-like chemotaxis protein
LVGSQPPTDWGQDAMSAIEQKRRRVVVVEDEPLIVMLITDMLEELGHTVVASSGTVEGALKLVEREAFDLALLDIDLAGKSGYAVADALAARGIAFVLMSGLPGKPRAPHQDRRMLSKPFQSEDLGQALKATIGSQ